jgi:hypothetical protein
MPDDQSPQAQKKQTEEFFPQIDKNVDYDSPLDALSDDCILININFVMYVRTTSHDHLPIGTNLIDNFRSPLVVWDISAALFVHKLYEEVFEKLVNPLLLVSTGFILNEGISGIYTNGRSSQFDDTNLLSVSSISYDTGPEPNVFPKIPFEIYLAELPIKLNKKRLSDTTRPTIIEFHNTDNASSQVDNRELPSSSTSSYIDTGHVPIEGQDAPSKSYIVDEPLSKHSNKRLSDSTRPTKT